MATRKVPKKVTKAAGKTSSRKRGPAKATVGGRVADALKMSAASPSFTVNDLQKSLAWYRDVLGFVLEDRWEEGGQLTGAQLRAGSVRFYIGQDDWKKGRDRKKGEGFRLYCQTSQDVDALAKKIVARGGALDYEPRDQPWGVRDFSLTDPDGFKITIAAQ